MENRIRDYRTLNNMSQEDLGKIMNVTGATVSSWEKGRTEPTIEQSSQMARMFGCTLEQLFGVKTNSQDYLLENEDIKLLIERYTHTDENTKEMVRRLLCYYEGMRK